MKRRILAILLTVCLAVGCLPVMPVHAATLTGNTEELYNFLKNYWYRLGYSVFDAKEPVLTRGRLLYFFLCDHPYDDSIYPGEDMQRYEPYTYSEKDLKYIKNDNYIPDPEGKCTGEEGTHYTKTSEEKFDWILENIFNISPEDIFRMKSELPNYYEGRYCYLHNGYYYVIDGVDSWGFRNIVIENVTSKGNLCYVRAADAVGKYYSVVEAKTLEGTTYWTLHYFAHGTQDYIPSGLPDDFDLGLAVLPPDILFAGKCGTASTYTMNRDILAISGTGEIADGFFSSVSAKSVVIDEGITTIGIGTFEGNWDTERYLCLNDVTIPTSVTDIKCRAFYDCRNLTDVYYSGTKEQWQKISIGEYNEPLLNATIHFAEQSKPSTSTPIPAPSPTPTPTPTPAPEPAPTPTKPITKTDTAANGAITTTTTWPDGKTSVKTQTPQGDTKLVVANSAGATVASISIPGNPGPSKQFTDVQSGWYKESIDKATALGLFSGTGANTFSPNAPMTRGMIATVLYRLSGEVGYGLGTGNFSDVKSGSWYKNAVDWAQATGVVTGTGSGFEPGKDVTREQLVTMLYRYAQLIGADSGNSTNVASFSDSGNVSIYAQEAMRWAVAEGFISGVGNNRLDPKGNATRAQVAAILTRFVDYLTGKPDSVVPAAPSEPTDTPTVQNGHYICPVCKFVNAEGVACIACAYNYQQAKSEVYCPTCGGGCDIGGLVPWAKCYYCNKYFTVTNDPVFTCHRCFKDGLRASDLDPESELCRDCYDPNPTYCKKCGLSSNIVSIDRDGFCEQCLGQCEVCGRTLTSIETAVYNGKRCYFCSRCDYCGGEITAEEYAQNGAFICSNCFNDLNGPNVWCPSCGYGFHTTGVGIEGFYCSQCGHRWMP